MSGVKQCPTSGTTCSNLSSLSPPLLMPGEIDTTGIDLIVLNWIYRNGIILSAQTMDMSSLVSSQKTFLKFSIHSTCLLLFLHLNYFSRNLQGNMSWATTGTARYLAKKKRKKWTLFSTRCWRRQPARQFGMQILVKKCGLYVIVYGNSWNVNYYFINKTFANTKTEKM